MYNLTYESLPDLFTKIDIASNGIFMHGIIWASFLIVFFALLGRFSIGKSLMVAGLVGSIFSIIMVGVGVGSPADMIIMFVLTVIGVMLR